MDLQGLNKAETAEKHGDEQVLLGSYDTPPPPMTKDDPGYAGKIIAGATDEANIPLTEWLGHRCPIPSPWGKRLPLKSNW